MIQAKIPEGLPNWMSDHVDRYLKSGGKDGHMYTIKPQGMDKEITVPSLLLVTKGPGHHGTYQTAGCLALAAALRNGALGRLAELKLSAAFSARDEGVTALARARRSTCQQEYAAAFEFGVRYEPLLV